MGVKSTSRTQRLTDDFDTPSSVAMACSVPRLGAQLTRSALFHHQAAVPHAISVRSECDGTVRHAATARYGLGSGRFDFGRTRPLRTNRTSAKLRVERITARTRNPCVDISSINSTDR